MALAYEVWLKGFIANNITIDMCDEPFSLNIIQILRNIGHKLFVLSFVIWWKNLKLTWHKLFTKYIMCSNSFTCVSLYGLVMGEGMGLKGTFQIPAKENKYMYCHSRVSTSVWKLLSIFIEFSFPDGLSSYLDKIWSY